MKNKKEGIKSVDVRSDRKDSIMRMGGCIMAPHQPAKANQLSPLPSVVEGPTRVFVCVCLYVCIAGGNDDTKVMV